VRQPVAAMLLQRLWLDGSGLISTQVLTEFYVVATRKFSPPLARREVRSIVDAYAAWTVVQVDPTLIVGASVIEERHQLSFWDALIIEAARRGGAARVVTEDLQHGQRIGGVLVENPFRQVGSST
jgi:predicted nucleic acid-binding protein